ncbi:BGTF surface domain-containing protein [Natronomonas sp. CBA1123]|uniref:DUF7282 domain-containing protein n=1 Tax=Natronomonas sp. CBA1123 TaxID=2668070 RepID=UPI0018D227A9
MTTRVTGLPESGAATFTLDLTLSDIDTTNANIISGVDYAVGATEGSTKDPYLDGQNDAVSSSTPESMQTQTFDINSASSDGGYSDEPSTDAPYVDGDLAFQGQNLRFEATSNPSENNYRLRNYDPTSAQPVGSVVISPTFTRTGDGSWVASIDTSNLEGSYTLTKNGNSEAQMVDTDEQGTETSIGGGDSGSAQAIDVLVQDLTVNLSDEDETLRVGDSTSVEFDSPARNGYTVNITEENGNLSGDDLSRIFGDATEIDEDTAQISGLDSEDEKSLTFNEDVVDAEDYEFNFDVVDTTAEDSVSVSLEKEVDAGADFDQAQFVQNRGDLAEINITAEGDLDNEDAEFDLIIGNIDEVGYQANVTVSPNETGQVSLLFNTYQAGQDQIGSVNLDSQYGESLVVAQEGEVVAVHQGTEDGTTLDEVVEADSYDLIAQEHTNSIDDLESGAEEYDLGVLTLGERSTDNITIHTAPGNDFSDFDNVDTILAGIEAGNVTESDEIAIAEDATDRSSQRRGDVIIHQLEVSGIFGALPVNPTVQDIVDSNAFTLQIEQQNPDTNRDSYNLDADATDVESAFHLVRDDTNNTIYIVADSDQLRFERGGSGDQIPQTEDEYEVQFNVTTSYLSQFTEESLDSPDDDESVNDTFEFVDREATFDTVDEEVRVQAADNQTISGTTTIAPGTEINVRARATADEGGEAFLKSADANVTANGTFEAEFTGEDSFGTVSNPPQNFTASIIQQSFEDNAETDGRVVEGDYAEVEISNQTSDGTTVTVDRVYVPDGGFVTIHDGTLLDGATFDSVRGTSDYLESGENTDVEVTLDTPYEGDNGTVIAMPHEDSNDNEEYDFVSSEGEDDAPYLNADGEIVLDSATLTVDTSTPTPTATPTATPESTPTATAEQTDEPTETESEDQPGFGAVIALIALLGAALLAARRNAF